MCGLESSRTDNLFLQIYKHQILGFHLLQREAKTQSRVLAQNPESNLGLCTSPTSHPICIILFPLSLSQRECLAYPSCQKSSLVNNCNIFLQRSSFRVKLFRRKFWHALSFHSLWKIKYHVFCISRTNHSTLAHKFYLINIINIIKYLFQNAPNLPGQ